VTEEKKKRRLPFYKRTSLSKILSCALVEAVGRACLCQVFSWARFSEHEAYFTQGFMSGVHAILKAILNEGEVKELYGIAAKSAFSVHPLKDPSEMESWVAKELVVMVHDALKFTDKSEISKEQRFQLEELDKKIRDRLRSIYGDPEDSE